MDKFDIILAPRELMCPKFHVFPIGKLSKKNHSKERKTDWGMEFFIENTQIIYHLPWFFYLYPS
jgi:hypothetical protein